MIFMNVFLKILNGFWFSDKFRACCHIKDKATYEIRNIDDLMVLYNHLLNVCFYSKLGRHLEEVYINYWDRQLLSSSWRPSFV